MLNNRKKTRRKAGFSLLEIMVVITIIALLGGIVGKNVMDNLAESKVNLAITQIRAYDDALKTYKLKTGSYPNKAEGLDALTKPVGLTRKAIMELIPDDPWNKPYIYIPSESSSTPPIVRTLGADSKVGGEGIDADVDSITIKSKPDENK